MVDGDSDRIYHVFFVLSVVVEVKRWDRDCC